MTVNGLVLPCSLVRNEDTETEPGDKGRTDVLTCMSELIARALYRASAFDTIP